ncbi:MAG TPA: hypothetical protein PKY55_15105 [bacterium]|nr:hypothetical protein [bacterium]HPG84609.1 hypothetical protein [bacterium]
MSEEIERLLNQPREFRIGEKTVTVEALPPGAVTLIIVRILDKIKKIDLEMLKEATKESQVESLYDLFEKRLQEAIVRDYEIFQAILTPAETWRRTKGNLKKTDYPVTLEELQWAAPELLLGEIFDEFIARNPRFAIQKKMVNLAQMQQQ